MKNKFQLFLELAQTLKNAFGIVPLLYGSLGLEYLFGIDLQSDDVDILIPNLVLTDRWPEFKLLFEQMGYVLVDESEHTFNVGEHSVSFAQIEDLHSFADILISDLRTVSHDNISFLLLSAEQYLRVYEASSRDGYRIHNRKKKDFEKILLLKEYIKKMQS